MMFLLKTFFLGLVALVAMIVVAFAQSASVGSAASAYNQ